MRNLTDLLKRPNGHNNEGYGQGQGSSEGGGENPFKSETQTLASGGSSEDQFSFNEYGLNNENSSRTNMGNRYANNNNSSYATYVTANYSNSSLNYMSESPVPMIRDMSGQSTTAIPYNNNNNNNSSS